MSKDMLFESIIHSIMTGALAVFPHNHIAGGPFPPKLPDHLDEDKLRRLDVVLFALGAMSLTWMALVTVLVAAERTLPRPARLGVAAVLVALGLWVALAPGAVPGLTVPDSGPGPMGGAMRMR